MTRRAAVFAAIVSFVTVAAAQPAGDAVRFERLSNGLRMAVVEDHALPLVSVQLWYAVGSRHDDPENPGLCHVARTILAHRDGASLRLRSAGARVDTATLRDAGFFSAVVPLELLDHVLDVEAERMRPLEVDAAMVTAGLSAARDYDETTDTERRLLAALLGGHPYRDPPEFVAASLAGLKPGDVQTFLDRWFVPGNATLLVIGDVAAPVVFERVRERFATLPWREPPRDPDYELPEPERIELTASTHDGTLLDAAWLTPRLGAFEGLAIEVLMQRLCNGTDGVLHRRLQQLSAQVARRLHVAWWHDGWRDCGVLRLRVVATDANFSRDEAAVLTSLTSRVEVELEAAFDQVLAEVPTPIAHNRARALVARRVDDSFAARAARAAEFEVVGGDILLERYRSPAAVTVADVQDAVRTLRRARSVRVRAAGQSPAPTASLPAPLPPTPTQQLGVAEVVRLLAESRQSAPGTRPDADRPSIEPPTAAGAIVRTCTVPGLSRTAVLTSLPLAAPARARAAAALRHKADIATDPSSQEEAGAGKLADYFSYHAMDLGVLEGSAGVALLSTQPPHRVNSAMELHAALLREYAGSERPQVIAVGDVHFSDIERAVGQVWPEGETDTKSRDRLEEAAAEPAGKQTLRIRFHLAPAAADSPNGSIVIRIQPSVSSVKQDGAGAALLRGLLGRAPYNAKTLDGRHAALWQHTETPDAAVVFRASLPGHRMADTVRDVVARIRQLAADPPAEEVRTALHLAAVERRVALDSPATIAKAIWRTRGDPWKELGDLDVADAQHAVTALLQGAAVEVSVSADRERRNALLVLFRELEDP